MLCKHVSDRAARYTEKSGPGEPVDEACDQHRLDVVRESAGEHPDEEECEGADVDWPAAVELVIWSVMGCLEMLC